MHVSMAWLNSIRNECAAASYTCAGLPQVRGYRDPHMAIMQTGTSRFAGKLSGTFVTPIFEEMMCFYKLMFSCLDSTWGTRPDANGQRDW